MRAAELARKTPDELRATAEQLARKGLSDREIAVELRLDVAGARRLLGQDAPRSTYGQN